MMEENVLKIIRDHIPAVTVEQCDENYKIILPESLKKMDKYKELQTALKESDAKPACPKCFQSNTRFRQFGSRSSCVLQAKYVCLLCNRLFILGGNSKQFGTDEEEQMEAVEYGEITSNYFGSITSDIYDDELRALVYSPKRLELATDIFTLLSKEMK